MATRASIASADRRSRERMHESEIRQRQRELKQKEQQMEREHVRGSAQAAGTILKGIASFNDPDFYKKFKVSEVMAKVPTFFRTGVPINPNWLTANNSGLDKCTDNLPGICVFRYYPTLPNGYGTPTPNAEYYKNSPINATLTRFMAELRKLNSRIGDYDPGDVGFYFYALSDIMENILMLAKAIKVYNTWYSNNANFARLMIRACGFDPDDFMAHYNEYKASCVKMIQQFNANAVLPKTLTFLQRRAWLASVIVRDHASATSQLYTFRKYCNVTLAEDESGLSVSLSSGYYTYSAFINMVNGQMESLFNSVGMVTITADLRAAFKPGDLLTIPELDPGAGVYYSESVFDLEQIHNIVTLPCKFSQFMVKDTAPTPLAFLSIHADPDGYLYQGTMNGGYVTPSILAASNFSNNEQIALEYNTLQTERNDSKFLNFYRHDEVNEDDVLEATRLRHVLGSKYTYSNATGFVPYACGTEIIGFGEIWVRDYSNNSIHFYSFVTDVVSDAYNTIPEEMIGLLSRFDWLPVYRHCYYFYVEDVNHSFYNTIGEIDHAVLLSNKNLEWLHEGCAFSEFYVDSQEFAQTRY